MDTKELFKPDRNQVIAVLAMVCAVFAFALGEIAIGFALFAAAAVFSLGGLFWNAHRQDQADVAEMKRAKDVSPSNPGKE